MKQENKSARERRREEDLLEGQKAAGRGNAPGEESRESDSIEALREEFHRMLEGLSFVSADDIPRIDLYMDQVLTFMEEHLASSARDPEHDKILTKTMINNYVKNDVLIPPVRKKYGMDHMLLLLMIYYLKSYLSIGDIQRVLEPLKAYCQTEKSEHALRPERTERPRGKVHPTDNMSGEIPAEDSSAKEENADGKKKEWSLEEIYRAVYENMEDEMLAVSRDADRQFERAKETFADADPEDAGTLQKFALIARMSTEIYWKKLFIERLLDETQSR